MTPFEVRTERRGALGHEVWVLSGPDGDLAMVCPALGFNCFRWRSGRNGAGAELLFATPTFLDGDRPTRSGVPVLFPFPNRIRDGRFTWEGKEYQLPLNDPAGKNAIHGFACRRPWRVLDHGADADGAWLIGEFHCSADDPESRPLWPADHRIRLTCRLLPGDLQLEATVDNPDQVPLPFGLGFHPYFRPPGADPDIALVQAAAGQYWELWESLPTGERVPADELRDLRAPRRLRGLQLDDVLTDLGDLESLCDLPLRASLRDGGAGSGLDLYTAADFRELVVFTPPHRQAVCLEPYTCTTDAINLQQRGTDAGLRVLAPGESWTGVVQVWGVGEEA
jgi:aldose 1-epimerase